MKISYICHVWDPGIVLWVKKQYSIFYEFYARMMLLSSQTSKRDKSIWCIMIFVNCIPEAHQKNVHPHTYFLLHRKGNILSVYAWKEGTSAEKGGRHPRLSLSLSRPLYASFIVTTHTFSNVHTHSPLAPTHTYTKAFSNKSFPSIVCENNKWGVKITGWIYSWKRSIDGEVV